MQKQKCFQLQILGPQSYLKGSNISHMYKVETPNVILTILSRKSNAHRRMEEL